MGVLDFSVWRIAIIRHFAQFVRTRISTLALWRYGRFCWLISSLPLGLNPKFSKYTGSGWLWQSPGLPYSSPASGQIILVFSERMSELVLCCLSCTFEFTFMRPSSYDGFHNLSFSASHASCFNASDIIQFHLFRSARSLYRRC